MLARDTVREQETIVDLSTRLLLNPYAWRTLVQVNKLRPPYVSPVSRPGVLGPGDTILYPSRSDGQERPTVDVTALINRTYKRDLAVADGDLILRDGRLVTVAGLENLKDAVKRRVLNVLGRHPFHPTYGSLAFSHVGRPADALRLRLLELDTRRAVLTDPRVQSVSVAAEFNPDVAHVVMNITPIAPGDPFIIRLPLYR